MFSLAFALAAQAAVAHPAPPAPQIDAQRVVAAIRPRLPQRFTADLALVDASAEGDLLILSFDVPPGYIQRVTPETLTSQLSTGICRVTTARQALESSMSLRIDARSTIGETMRGAVIESCPAPAAAQQPAA